MEKQYSIGELALLSQVKAHTIRIWEQRYNLLSPSRSVGNTRYYNEKQLMKLLNVALLRKSGLKISEIASMTEPELINKAEEYATSGGTKQTAVDLLMNASLHFEQATISKLFNSYIEHFGVEKTFEDIVFPFLKIIGNLWVNGKITPGQEHFFTNMCKLKLFSVIDQLPLPSKSKEKIILALPEWDYHELGILYYHYLLKKAGYPVTYLGQAVPADDVILTAKNINAQYIILTFIGPTTEKEINNYLDKIITNTMGTHLFISGPHVVKLKNRQLEKVTVFMSMEALVKKFNLKQ